MSQSAKKIEAIEDNFQKVETVSDFIQEGTKEDKLTTVALDKEEVNAVKNAGGEIIIEKDIHVHASGKKIKHIKKKDIDMYWNKKIINCGVYKRKEIQRKVKVAIIDSGVDLGNDIELEDSISLVPGEKEMNPLFMDGTGHGNSVAGLIAAKDNDEGITGINPNAMIYSVRVLDDNNEAPLSRVIEGIYYAISKNVDIINMSFGIDCYSEALKQAIDEANKSGILMIASAGNTGKDVQYPAAYENVLSVGSVNSELKLSDTSARGEKLDVVAPGELVCTTGEFGDLLIETGTSLAAPQVAAVASKVMEENPNASAEQVKNAIINGANYSIKDNYGLLDEEYVLKNFKDLKDCIKKKVNNDIVKSINTGCVRGSWIADTHGSLVGANHSNVKAGARYPDTNNSGFEKISLNPWWHGSYHSNYIATYVYATRIAETLGQQKAISTTSIPGGLLKSDASNMRSDVEKLCASNFSGFKKLKMDTKGKRRAFMWGIAIHNAADIFAHSAFVYSKTLGKWCHLAHGENGINNYADKPSKYYGRYYAAENAVNKIIKKYDNNNGGGSYKQFSGIGASEKEYRLKNLVKNIKATTSDPIGKPYSDYDVSNEAIIEYYW